MINLCQILWDKAKSVPYETYIYNSVTESVSYRKAALRSTKLVSRLVKVWVLIHKFYFSPSKTFSAATVDFPKSRYSRLSLIMPNFSFIS